MRANLSVFMLMFQPPCMRSGVTRVSCARGQKQRSAPPPSPSPRPTSRRCHVVSVSIDADVRKILRGLVHFEHPRHDETRGYVIIRGVGCHTLPAGVWGAMKCILGVGHKNANYCRLVAR